MKRSTWRQQPHARPLSPASLSLERPVLRGGQTPGTIPKRSPERIRRSQRPYGCLRSALGRLTLICTGPHRRIARYGCRAAERRMAHRRVCAGTRLTLLARGRCDLVCLGGEVHVLGRSTPAIGADKENAGSTTAWLVDPADLCPRWCCQPIPRPSGAKHQLVYGVNRRTSVLTCTAAPARISLLDMSKSGHGPDDRGCRQLAHARDTVRPGHRLAAAHGDLFTQLRAGVRPGWADRPSSNRPGRPPTPDHRTGATERPVSP